MEEDSSPAPSLTFDCSSCGADLHFHAGTTSLTCPFCGATTTIDVTREKDPLHEYKDLSHTGDSSIPTFESLALRCNSCGAETTLPESRVADFCVYCGAHLIATEARNVSLQQPESLLPFRVNEQQASEALQNWLTRVRFAPNNLKKYAERPRALHGSYLPYWSFDCETATTYTGQRGKDKGGKHSYVTYEEVINGRKYKRTRQMRGMKWTPVQGQVNRRFTEMLVLASKSADRERAQNLEPWGLDELVPFRKEFLAGFYVERYQLSPEEGFEIAKERMLEPIRSRIHENIGGDEQKILTAETKYSDVRFRHILLPVWLGAYRYNGKVFQILVNGVSGEVQGARPWSIWKVGLLILGVIALLLSIILLSARN